MTKKVNPTPTLTTPVLLQDINSIRLWAATLTQNAHKELKDHAIRLNLALERDGLDRMEAPLPLQLVLTAALPAAADWQGGIVFVTDDADGPQPFFSDGTTWYRFYDLLNLSSTLSDYLLKAQNLADLANVTTARSNLGLGTAAVLNVGTGANNIVQLDGSSKLPAVDGSVLTNLPAQAGRLVAGTALVANPVPTNTNTTQAHGLGVVPVYLKFELECLTAELGFNIGDVLYHTNYVNTYLINATNVVYVSGANAASVIRPDTHAAANLTNSRWKMTITPYKLTT